MIRIAAMTRNHQITKNITINNLDRNAYKWIWVDFNQPTEEEIRHLGSTFHFHPLAIEDCIHRLQRPKLDHYEDHTFFVTHSIQEKEEELHKGGSEFLFRGKLCREFSSCAF